MRVGIIAALDEEIVRLRQRLADAQQVEKAGFRFDTGRLEGVDVVLLKSDIGKVNAAIGTTLLLDDWQPDAVINTGSAGGFDPALEVGDLIISEAVCHHDVDVTPFGYAPGQVPGMPACFPADRKLIRVARQAVAEVLPDVQHRTGLIGSGDRFMHEATDVEKVRATFPALLAVEMEAAAIAQACHRFGTPFVIIRALSDIAGKENVMAFEQFLPLAAERASTLVAAMLSQLATSA